MILDIVNLEKKNQYIINTNYILDKEVRGKLIRDIWIVAVLTRYI